MRNPPNRTPDAVMSAFIEYLKRQNHLHDPLPGEEKMPGDHRGIDHIAYLYGITSQALQALVDIYIGKDERDALRTGTQGAARLCGHKVRSRQNYGEFS